jgi:hypothetical protein
MPGNTPARQNCFCPCHPKPSLLVAPGTAETTTVTSEQNPLDNGLLVLFGIGAMLGTTAALESQAFASPRGGSPWAPCPFQSPSPRLLTLAAHQIRSKCRTP